MIDITQKTEQLQKRVAKKVFLTYFNVYGVDAEIFPAIEGAESSLYGNFSGSVDFALPNPPKARVVFFQSPNAVFIPTSLTDLAIGEVEFIYLSEEVSLNSVIKIIRDDEKELLFKLESFREQGLTLSKFQSYEISSYER